MTINENDWQTHGPSISRLCCNLQILTFVEGRKPQISDKTLSEQGQQTQTTYDTRSRISTQARPHLMGGKSDHCSATPTTLPLLLWYFSHSIFKCSLTHYFFSKLNTLHSLTWLSLWPHTFLFMSTLMPNMIHWCQTVLLNTLSTKPCYFYFQIRNQYVSNHHVSVLSPLSLFSHGQSHMLKTIIILCLATL